jgi:sensor histidine kinase YesM
VHSSDEWTKEQSYRNLYDRVKTISYERLTSAAHALFYIGDYIVEQELLNQKEKQLAENNIKLLEEARQRTELEKNVQEMELLALSNQIKPHFLFNVLNAIGRFAMIEGAKKTEEMVYTFSDMMRYILKRDSKKPTTIKDEIAYTENYLALQKIRLGSRLNYTINIPEKWNDLECPFMIMQPIVENSIKYVVEARSEGGTICITAGWRKDELVLSFKDDGDGMSKEMIDEILGPEGMKKDGESCIGLHNINMRLIAFSSKKHGLKIESDHVKGGGTTVKIRLPLIK